MGRTSSRVDTGLLPRASVVDTVRAAAQVVIPIAAQGVIARRPRVVALAERLQADDRAVRLLQRLRARYGSGPLLLRVPGRSVALVLDPDEVGRVLVGEPHHFAPANLEKRGALSHFQPHGVLVSSGSARTDRRRFNEAVLDTGQPLHHLAGSMVHTIREEAALVSDAVARTGVLHWDDFIAGWRRSVRRIVLGDSAREDHEISEQLDRLRSAANWTYLHPGHSALRERYRQRLQAYLDEAQPNSLAAVVAQTSTSGETDPADQLPQWLFAFNPAAMAAYRTLALLAVHREQAELARAELIGRDLSAPQELPQLRAAVLESVRLWPTTAVVLRDSTTETSWNAGTMPSGTALLIVSSFFHRDDRTLPQADRFDPDLWRDGGAREGWALFPFSGGPGRCPGRELVLFTTSMFLAALLERHELRLTAPSRLHPDRPLPRTLDPFTLRFEAGQARDG